MKSEKPYFLGTHEAELRRLEFQAKAWESATAQLWKNAGISEGKTILDLGCGPGFSTLPLSRLVGPKGKIIAIDKSGNFLNFLKQRIQEENIKNVEVHEVDVDRDNLPVNPVDVVFVRWLHQYVDNLDHVLSEEIRCLKPGGLLAVHEVFHFEGTSISPQSEVFANITNTIVKYYSKNKRDISIGGKIPSAIAKRGMKIQSLSSVCPIAQSHEPLWEWYKQFSSSMVQRLIDESVITESTGDAFQKVWLDLQNVKGAFVSVPSHIQLIAQKV